MCNSPSLVGATCCYLLPRSSSSSWDLQTLPLCAAGALLYLISYTTESQGSEHGSRAGWGDFGVSTAQEQNGPYCGQVELSLC